MNQYFAYIRVSTAKQGEHGVSLQEQRDAITRYAQQRCLDICEWFEERVTAAKRGRHEFNRMLSLLRRGRARGVIIHKIDRSARNLKDWSDMGELIDAGIDVHFVSDNLDLATRGGRLSADIQAVVAADYIRNLREETRKGFYGRLKQGVYPLPAPVGYLDQGAGKPKALDPAMASLVREVFEAYATGRYNIDQLVAYARDLGLTNRQGVLVSRSGVARFLRNPFYIGIIRIKNTGETFHGNHETLISARCFEEVQRILDGKGPKKTVVHDHEFRRLFRCEYCGYSLVGELQKGRVYYRCHTDGCPTSVREDVVESAILQTLAPLEFPDEARAYLGQLLEQYQDNWAQEQHSLTKSLDLRLSAIQDRLNRLTDAYIDQAIDRAVFESRKTALFMEQRNLEDRRLLLSQGTQPFMEEVRKFLELVESACSSYKSALGGQKRRLLEVLSSNRSVKGRNVMVTLSQPFQCVAEHAKCSYGAPYRTTPRTLRQIFHTIVTFCQHRGVPGDAASETRVA